MNEFPKFLKDLDPNIYESENYTVLDFETTNLDKGSALVPDNSIVAATTINNGTKELFSQHLSDSNNGIKQILQAGRSSDFIVAQFAKFELQWLYRIGIEPGSILVWDTMLAQYVINGNRKTELNLDYIAKRYGLGQKHSLVKLMIEGGVCPSLIPEKRLLEYNMQDVQLTHSIFLAQREELRELGLLPVMFTRCLTSLVLADIEKNGMCLDPKRVKDEYKQVLNDYKEIEADIHEITGGINPRSPQQVGKYLYDTLGFDEQTDYRGEPIRTDGGSRSTGLEVILALKAKTPEQRKFKALVERFSPLKTKKTTLEKMARCCEENKGILNAQFNQTVTRNHRLSSTGKHYKMQLQNVDRDFKRLFKPRSEGWKVADPDATQLEFRVAVQLTGDPQGLKDIEDDFDVHRYTASVINKKPLEAVTDKERADLKPHTFKPVYLGESGTPDERRYYKAFQQKYNTMYKTQKGWCYEVLKTKKFQSVTGLTFYWPNVEVYESGYIKYTNEIANYPVSNLATGEITMIGLVYLWYLFKINKLQAFINNTVHDADIVELPENEEKQVWDYAKQAFGTLTIDYLKKIYDLDWYVPLGVEMKVGNHWGEGKKYKYKLEL